MINGVTREFGEVTFDEARVPADHMIGRPGEGWAIAMTVVSHEREPHELGFASRYRKTVKELTARVAADPDRHDAEARRDLAWAIVEADMLQRHVSRRLSDRLDGIEHGPEGSIDKLLMTWVEQAVGHAALSIGAPPTTAATTPPCGPTSTAGPRASWAARRRSSATSSPGASWACRPAEGPLSRRSDPATSAHPDRPVHLDHPRPTE
jgi:hypothetical protein